MKLTQKTMTMTALFVLIAAWAFAGGISTADRSKAISHLSNTRDLLLKTVKNLNDEQLNYKPSAESWSIAECVEHIAVSEELIFAMAQGTLKEAVDASTETSLAFSDDQLVQVITDRSQKVQTREEFKPTNKYDSYKGSLKAFKAKRKSNIDYLKGTQDDLRNHYFQFPFGTADTYQVLLFMSAHSKRHILQIEEIMGSAGFPD